MHSSGLGHGGLLLFTRSPRLEPPSGGLSQLPLIHGIQKLAQPGVQPPRQVRCGLGVWEGEKAQEHESGWVLPLDLGQRTGLGTMAAHTKTTVIMVLKKAPFSLIMVLKTT